MKKRKLREQLATVTKERAEFARAAGSNINAQLQAIGRKADRVTTSEAAHNAQHGEKRA